VPVPRERITVIEDDADLAELLAAHLEAAGYLVDCAADAAFGIRLVADTAPAAVLLDLGLPDTSGFEVCRRLRQDPATRDVPIVIMTVRDAEADVVRALDLGADDYVVKPLRANELVARLRAVLRRRGAPAAPAPDRIEAGVLVIDLEKHEARLDGATMELTPTQMRLLHCLAGNPGRVFTREQLRHRAIGGGAVVVDRNIDVHVRAIRKALGAHEDLVETVRGVGYRFADAAG
jgi:two-component system phosphate regulon response regulator PhoB